MELNGRLDVRHVLGSIRVPTLLLHRTHDAGIGVEHSRYLAEHIPGARLVELEGADTFPFLGDSAAVIGEVDEFLTGDRRPPDHDRVLATVLFTDIVGSTVRAAALGDEIWRDLLERARPDRPRLPGAATAAARSSRSATASSRVFDGPARAVRAARSIVADVTALGLERPRRPAHGRGGAGRRRRRGAGGPHRGARHGRGARRAGCFTSSTVHDLVVGSGLRFEERGRRVLRGVPGRVGPVGGDGLNFARDVVEAAPPGKLAIVELARDGTRREWRFGEVAEQAALLHAQLATLGVRRGDVVLTLLGNRPEWVLAMVACFRPGYVVLPCTEQLRAEGPAAAPRA